jgi:hypothetical protein
MQHPHDDDPITSQPIEDGVAGVLMAEVTWPDMANPAAQTGCAARIENRLSNARR